MHNFNLQKTALTFGFFFAGVHIVWSLLILLGVGQMFYDFVLWAHMLHINLTVGPFDLTAALALVVVTFVIGYLFGLLFAYIWNYLHKEKTA